MATNVQPTSTGTVQRKTHTGDHISLLCPESIILYNSFMGVLIEVINSEDTTLRAENYTNTSVITNSYILYKTTPNIQLKNIKDYRLQLAKQLSGDYCNRR